MWQREYWTCSAVKRKTRLRIESSIRICPLNRNYTTLNNTLTPIKLLQNFPQNFIKIACFHFRGAKFNYFPQILQKITKMDSENPPSSDANALLYKLIKMHMPNGLDPKLMTRYFAHFSRIQSSNLTPRYSNNEEQVRICMNNHIDNGDYRDKASRK